VSSEHEKRTGRRETCEGGRRTGGNREGFKEEMDEKAKATEGKKEKAADGNCKRMRRKINASAARELAPVKCM